MFYPQYIVNDVESSMLIGRALSAASRRWSAAVTVGVVDVDFLRDFRLLDNQGIQTHNDDNDDDDDG